MYFASNLQFLRRRKGITQEKLANQLGVSRQAISKWESGETIPEVSTLLQLAELFSCKLDDLLRQELSAAASPVRIVTVKGFRMVRHCLISPNAREDLRILLQTWVQQQGLTDTPLLMWNFPYTTQEQKQQFSMEGVAAALVLPEYFSPMESAYPICAQSDCTYALLTMEEPDGRSHFQIAQGIRTILEALQVMGIPKSAKEGFLPCFERHYEKNGVAMADLYLQCHAPSDTEVTITS